MPRYAQRPDANQREIDAAAQALGAEWIETSKLPGGGCDRVYLFRGRVLLSDLETLKKLARK